MACHGSPTNQDALGETLDKALGDTVTDHSVFDAHCKHFEKDYFEDMRSLGIQVKSVSRVVFSNKFPIQRKYKWRCAVWFSQNP